MNTSILITMMTLNIETTKLSLSCLLNQKSWKTKLPRKIRREKLKIWTQGLNQQNQSWSDWLETQQNNRVKSSRFRPDRNSSSSTSITCYYHLWLQDMRNGAMQNIREYTTNELPLHRGPSKGLYKMLFKPTENFHKKQKMTTIGLMQWNTTSIHIKPYGVC